MQLTVSEILDRIDSIRAILRGIESGGSISHCTHEIADYLNEYVVILSNIKVKV